MPVHIASDIPVGTQFSPNLVKLPAFLQALVTHSGNVAEMKSAVWQAPVHIQSVSVPSSRRRANLPLEAAVQYGLLEERTYEATDLAKHLVGLPETKLYEEFARHILLNLGGLRVVQGIEQMQADYDAGLSDTPVTADSLARFLTAQGFLVIEHNTAINSLRMWLAKAGLFPERTPPWRVNQARKRELVGLDDDTIGALADLTPVQIAFMEALCQINPAGWYRAADVRDLAESVSGVRFGRSSLPNEVLRPLSDTGLIEFRTRGTSGGKTAELRTTPKFSADVLAPFVTNTIKSLDAVSSRYYTRRPDDIYAGLVSADTYEKGAALEAYAIHLMRLLGLRLIGWRKRAKESTGQAEVDVMLAGVFGGAATTWQVQCKNTPSASVDLEDVAKEVGLTPITKATHLLFVANSSFTDAARQYSGRVMEASGLSIYLLDSEDFEQVKASPGAVGRILRSRSEAIVRSRLAKPGWIPARP